jgi:acyl carrier protein
MATSPKPKKKKNDPFPKIQAIIAKQLKKEPGKIVLKAKLQTDLGADSLDALEIVFQLEEDFDIKIGEEEAKEMISVRDIVTAITKKLKEK